MKNNTDESIEVSFRAADSACGLTRATWTRVANAHGLSEADALHRAMVLFASTSVGKVMASESQRGYPSDLAGWDFGEFAEAIAKAAPELLDTGRDLPVERSRKDRRPC